MDEKIEKRETQKDITFRQRKFRIKKMDARQACYVVFQLKALLPIIIPFISAEKGKDFDAGALMGALNCGMNRKDFFQLQNDCLSCVYHIEKAGEIPVLDENNGNFTDDNLKDDAPTIAILFVQSLAFNVKDFFEESFLAEFKAPLRNTMPSTATM